MLPAVVVDCAAGCVAWNENPTPLAFVVSGCAGCPKLTPPSLVPGCAAVAPNVGIPDIAGTVVVAGVAAGALFPKANIFPVAFAGALEAGATVGAVNDGLLPKDPNVLLVVFPIENPPVFDGSVEVSGGTTALADIVKVPLPPKLNPLVFGAASVLPKLNPPLGAVITLEVVVDGTEETAGITEIPAAGLAIGVNEMSDLLGSKTGLASLATDVFNPGVLNNANGLTGVLFGGDVITLVLEGNVVKSDSLNPTEDSLDGLTDVAVS